MTSIDKDKAKTNPSSVFDKPADVVTHKDLKPEEKAEIRQEWELEARLTDVAIDEGMTSNGEEGLNNVAEESLLPEVKRPRTISTPSRSRTKERRLASRPKASICDKIDAGAVRADIVELPVSEIFERLHREYVYQPRRTLLGCTPGARTDQGRPKSLMTRKPLQLVALAAQFR